MKIYSALLAGFALAAAFGQGPASSPPAGPPAGPPSASELAEISARGRALADYDAAAWHGTDAVMALKPPQGSFQLYIARKSEYGWVVVFGRFDETRSRFLIVYEARQKGNSTEYEAVKHDPPLQDSDVYLRAAKADELVKTEFLSDTKPQRSYNISILPVPAGDWYVYAIPAQTDLTVLPFGGDIRYTVVRDGTRIVERRQMHKTVLEEKIAQPPYFGFHTHVLSNLPEDSDVFYALTRKAVHGEWVATPKYVYQIDAHGSLAYLGKLDEITKQLPEGKFDASIPPSIRSAVLSTLQRLPATAASDPLESVASFTGARCLDKSIWLKFSITVRNTSDTKMVLYKDALDTAQARFAATEADIRAGKYEKLVFGAIKQLDLSNNDLFIVLDPGRSYSQEHEYPILGLDLKGKAVVQFLYIPWPLGQEKQQDAQRARWAKTGSLYTETIFATPSEFWVNPKMLKSCTAK